MVTVTEVDAQRKRIALSMKDAAAPIISSTPKSSNSNSGKKGKPEPPANDFASQLAALKDKFK
jgi:ribosomal protein S1